MSDSDLTQPAPARVPHAEKRPKPLGPEEFGWAPPSVNGFLSAIGSFLRFALTALALIPSALREFPSEVFRYAGILVRGSALVVLFMLFNLGFLTGLLAHVTLEPLGVTALDGGALSVALFRGLVQVIVSWVVAAKIGCGIVTELGAMRITEEIDALEVMGINPVTYLVSTRVFATFLVVPGLLLAGYWMAFWGAWLFDVPFLGSTASGPYWEYLWKFQNAGDFLIVTIWGVLSVALVTIIAAYFGYTVKGGPVGVGQNTAQSMLVSMALVTIVAAVMIQLAYGLDANSPVSN